jgi:hypothetical protein
MGKKNMRGSLRAALLLAIAAGVPLTAAARQHREPEQDDAGARAQAMDEWYNEHYAGRHAARDDHHKKALFSPKYERFLMQAARRERLRNGRMLPRSGTSKMMIDPSLALPEATAGHWLNIGPTKADHLINYYTLYVTDSGRVNGIVTDPYHPDTIYVAFSGGGLWKSSDGGAFWQAKTETLGSLSVGAVAMDPKDANTLYLGLGDPFDGTGIGLVKSIDGADTWSDPVFLGNSTVISDIKVSPSNSSIVLVATNGGLYRSTNAGASFSQVSITPSDGGVPVIWSITVTGSHSFALSLLAGDDDGEIWHSSDNGATWTRSTGIASGTGRISLDAAPSKRAIVYATAALPSGGNDLSNIYKSSDGGASWTGIAKSGSAYKSYTNPNGESATLDTLLNGQGWYNHMTLVDRSNPNIAYFGGALLMARTTDGGKTFSQATNWLAQFGLPYVHADFHAGHVSSNGTLYVGTDGGIFASTNHGKTFTDTLNEGIASHLIYDVGSSPADPDAVIVGLQDNGTRVRDADTSVFNQQLGGDGFGCAINQADATRMLGSLYYDRILKSVDGGNTFSVATAGIPDADTGNAPFVTVLSPWAGDPSGNTVYTFSNTTVYKTTDFADSWAALGTNGLTQAGLFIRGVAAAPGNANVIGVVANGGRMFLSSDGGNYWAIPSGQLTNNDLSLSSVAFDPTNTSIVYVSSVAPNQSASHLWRSANFGASWTQIDSGASGFPAGIPVNAVQVDPVTPSTLYAATQLGVYRSTDSGSSWSRFGSGLPLVNVTKLYVSSDDSLIRAATYGRSVWELTQDTTNAPPTAQFSASSTGLLAQFTDLSSDTDGTIQSRAWTFGDDSATSTATNPAHAYRSGGTYKVTLAVKDSGGSSGFISHSVVVVAPATSSYSASSNATIHSGVTESTITVTGRSGNAPSNAHVTVNMQYPRRGDLRIDLVGPDGTVYPLKAASATDSRRYLATTYTVDLSAQSLNGDWVLRVTDTTAANDGFLTGWKLAF